MNENNIWTRGSIHGDEYYTLEKTANIIAHNMIHIPHLKIWCPFNDADSVWGGVLMKHGFDAICTETDFFVTDPPEGCNAIVSNPPFSIKQEIMDRTKELKIPFVYILPFTWMNDGIPFEYGHQVMFFRKRMHFRTESNDLNKPRSNCFVLSNGLLKRDMTVIWDEVGDAQYRIQTRI